MPLGTDFLQLSGQKAHKKSAGAALSCKEQDDIRPYDAKRTGYGIMIGSVTRKKKKYAAQKGGVSKRFTLCHHSHLIQAAIFVSQVFPAEA